MDAKGKPRPPSRLGDFDSKAGHRLIANPNKGVLWQYGGFDKKGDEVYWRTMSTCAVYKNMVFTADLAGFVHCLDLQTGARIWRHDLLAEIWGSPMVVDGHLLLGTADGDLYIMEAGRKAKVLKHHLFASSIFTTPTIAGRTLYISNLSKLYSIDLR